MQRAQSNGNSCCVERDRAINSRTAFTVWLTGLPCSGKSTLLALLSKEMARRGIPHEALDSDILREHMSKELGFNKADREENIHRIGYVCSVLARHNIPTIVAAITPYRSMRERLRLSNTHFVEVYVKASIETCVRRDVKGLYKKALEANINNFTGVSDVYEAPSSPDLTLETEQCGPSECVSLMIQKLESLGYVPNQR